MLDVNMTTVNTIFPGLVLFYGKPNNPTKQNNEASNNSVGKSKFLDVILH
jgi:hypothetical protein